MFSDKKLFRLQSLLRLAAALTAIGLPMGLFVGGAQPVAVGLIPVPWDKLGYASGWRGWPMLLAGFGYAMGIGVLDEWHQMYLPGRSAGLEDLAADAAGAALGATALLARDQIEGWLMLRLG